MDVSSSKDGYFIASDIVWPEPSPRFWLRLAHEHGYNNGPHQLVHVRRILDFEWILQIEGDSCLVLPDLKLTLAMPEGSVTLVPPYLIHGQGRDPSQHIAVHFDFEANPQLKGLDMSQHLQYTAPKYEATAQGFLRFIQGEQSYDVPMIQQVKDLDRWKRNALHLVKSWNLGGSSGIRHQLEVSQILAEMANTFLFSPQGHDTNPDESTVRNILSELDPSDRSLRIEDLAQRCSMGQTSFRKMVHQVTGKSPRVWLEDLRCEKAERLLIDNRLTISDISMVCGYEDPYHFSRVFKRTRGYSPRSFRHQRGSS